MFLDSIGVKFACQRCITGHRTGDCAHDNRTMVHCKKVGRQSNADKLANLQIVPVGTLTWMKGESRQESRPQADRVTKPQARRRRGAAAATMASPPLQAMGTAGSLPTVGVHSNGAMAAAGPSAPMGFYSSTMDSISESPPIGTWPAAPSFPYLPAAQMNNPASMPSPESMGYPAPMSSPESMGYPAPTEFPESTGYPAPMNSQAHLDFQALMDFPLPMLVDMSAPIGSQAPMDSTRPQMDHQAPPMDHQASAMGNPALSMGYPQLAMGNPQLAMGNPAPAMSNPAVEMSEWFPTTDAEIQETMETDWLRLGEAGRNFQLELASPQPSRGAVRMSQWRPTDPEYQAVEAMCEYLQSPESSMTKD